MKNLKIFVLFVLLFLSFSSFICFLLFSLSKRHETATTEELEKSVHEYKYYEIDYLQKETSFGVVSLFDEIEHFKTYDDFDLQKSYLISPFGTEEYECIGSCYCENEETRRSSRQSKVLIEGVSYLLASVSSLIAYNAAKDHFDKKCSEKFSNVCESKSIFSDVSDCEKVTSKFNTGEEEIIDDSTRDVEKRTYFCYGNCVDNTRSLASLKYRPLAEDKGFDCSKLKHEGEVTVSSDNLNRKSHNSHISVKMASTAKSRFVEHQLAEYCRKNSEIEYEFESYYVTEVGKEKVPVTKKRKGYLCASGTGRKIFYSNCHCRQIDPVSHRADYWNKKFFDKKRIWDES